MTVNTSNNIENSKTNPRNVLRQIATGFILSRALTIAAELKVADTLKESEKTATEIANELSLHADSLYRLMRFLASHNIFSENSINQFSLTPLSEIMVSNTPDSIHAYLTMLADDPPWDSIKNIVHTIRTGEPAFEHLHNQKFFDFMKSNPEPNERFNAGMSCFSSPDDSHLVNAYEFSNGRTIVDIGGGKGSFLASILSKHKELNGILYDQEEIVNQPVESINQHLVERCKIVSGDFFESIPAHGDIYTLKLILHDWDDEHAVKILNNCHQAMPTDGKLLVIEGIMLDGNQYDPHKQLDISMMLIFGGRERTQKEFDILLKSAGFRTNRILSTHSRLSIIEAVKA